MSCLVLCDTMLVEGVLVLRNVLATWLGALKGWECTKLINEALVTRVKKYLKLGPFRERDFDGI